MHTEQLLLSASQGCKHISISKNSPVLTHFGLYLDFKIPNSQSSSLLSSFKVPQNLFFPTINISSSLATAFQVLITLFKSTTFPYLILTIHHSSPIHYTSNSSVFNILPIIFLHSTLQWLTASNGLLGGESVPGSSHCVSMGSAANIWRHMLSSEMRTCTSITATLLTVRQCRRHKTWSNFNSKLMWNPKFSVLLNCFTVNLAITSVWSPTGPNLSISTETWIQHFIEYIFTVTCYRLKSHGIRVQTPNREKRVSLLHSIQTGSGMPTQPPTQVRGEPYPLTSI